MLHVSWHQDHVCWLLLRVKDVRILFLLLSSALLLDWRSLQQIQPRRLAWRDDNESWLVCRRFLVGSTVFGVLLNLLHYSWRPLHCLLLQIARLGVRQLHTLLCSRHVKHYLLLSVCHRLRSRSVVHFETLGARPTYRELEVRALSRCFLLVDVGTDIF